MDTITPPSSILPVGAIATQGRERQPQGQQLPAAGQVFKAMVVEATGNNLFVLDIAGNRLQASSEARLTVGQMLQLQVTRTEPHIELKIVHDTLNRFFGKSLTLLGKNIDLAQLFEAVKNHVPPVLPLLSPTSRNVLESFYSLQQSSFSEKEGGAILKNLIESLGLNLEHFLARGDKQSATQTLKAALLEMAATFSSARNLAETTQKLLTTLELFQFAQVQAGSNTHLIFPLPLPFVEQGYLIIEQDSQGDETQQTGSHENRFSLHLTMSELGNLRISFLHNQEGLFIRFQADSQEKADFIASHRDELRAAITDAPLVSLAFSGDAPDPINDLIKSLIPQGTSMLDTKV